jgi:uncharacterized protein (DUF2252 family)
MEGARVVHTVGGDDVGDVGAAVEEEAVGPASAPTATSEVAIARNPRAERAARGRALRTSVPRASHGDWRPAAGRLDPIAVVERTNRGRLPEYIPIRHGRMLASPFAFLRGAAAVMAHDLAPTPATGITVQVAGDAHLLNFGVFGTQERNLSFGINDFDETLPGPWEWDVKRLAASAVVAVRDIGGSEDRAVEGARAAVREYRTRMREYASYGGVELWYTQIRGDQILPVLHPHARAAAQEWLARARGSNSLEVLERSTEIIDGDFRIVDHPPLIVHASTDELPLFDRAIEGWSTTYRRSLLNDRRRLLDEYHLVDAARKVVGVGSVGTRCFVVLLRGADDRDPLFLQVKQALPSALAPFLGRRDSNHGRRVVEGQRLIQPTPDIFLGWGRTLSRESCRFDFYVRQLRDMKGSASADPATAKPRGLVQFAELCGWALALAHARSGDASAISGYLGMGEAFDDAIVRFAVAYADQTERDHAAFAAAIKAGRIAAEIGV